MNLQSIGHLIAEKRRAKGLTLTQLAAQASVGRELTKAAIDDIISRGTIGTWRKLIQAMNADKTGRIARRVMNMAQVLGKRDSKARAFAALLRKLPRKAKDTAIE